MTFRIQAGWFVVGTVAIVGDSMAAIEYTSYAEWDARVRDIAVVGFDEYPHATLIMDQFSRFGVHFTDGDDYSLCCDPLVFPQDSAGLGSGEGSIHLVFDSPIHAIAIDYPGEAWFSIFRDGELIHQSSGFGSGSAGLFRGVVSEVAFDEVLLTDPVDETVFLDTLYVSIPTPAAFASLSVALLCWRRKRCEA